MMVTNELKNKVDKIWTDLWAGGITNPLTVVEQLTYLMFIRSLDDKELETEEMENTFGEEMPKIFPKSEIGQSMRWHLFKDKDPREIYDLMVQRIFPAIKQMKHGKLPDFNEKGEMIFSDIDYEEHNSSFVTYMENATFSIPTPQVLSKIITGLEDVYTRNIKTVDMLGDLYEYMLDKLRSSGTNGQFVHQHIFVI